MIRGRRNHFEAGRDRPGSENVILADNHIFQSLLSPLRCNVFGHFAVVKGTCGMRDGGEVAMLLANFSGGDGFLQLVFETGLFRGMLRGEAADFCSWSGAEGTLSNFVAH